MSSEPITNEELDRLEALHNDAPEQMTDEVLDMEIREWRVFPVEGAESFYDAARDALPKLLAECRSARALLAKSDELIVMQSALIRTFERGQAIDLAALAQARAENTVTRRQLQHQRLLAAENTRLRAVLHQIAHDPYIDQNAAAVRERARTALNPQEPE